MKIKAKVAAMLGVAEASVVILRSGGWTTDQSNQEEDKSDWDPDFNAAAQSYYVECAIKKQDETLGSPFRIDVPGSEVV